MATFKTKGLSDPNLQFTQVQARQDPDTTREKVVGAVLQGADVAGKAIAKSNASELTGADSSLADINEQADAIDQSIDRALGEEMTEIAGPLQERDVNEIKDRELTRFTTDDRTLRELRDRGTISTTEARARRQLNLRRQLSNPINAMFKEDFLNASGDMTGGGAGAAAALFPYTAEEETAMAIAEEQRKVQAEHEAQVFDIQQKTSQPEEFVRTQLQKEEVARQDLANYEAIQTKRNLNSEESAQYQVAMEGSATRGMTLQVSTLMTQDGGKGLSAVSTANASRTLEYQYNGMLQKINTNKGIGASHRDKAIERLDKWKSGMETFIKAHSLTDFNANIVEGLKNKAVVANWEAAPQMMAMATTYPEMAKVYFESAGQIESRMEQLMGPEGYAVWKAKIGGDPYGEMGKFQNGETADPAAIGAFNTPGAIEYLSKRAAEDPAVRTNLLKAYNEATAVSLSGYNSINAAMYAPKSEDYRVQISEAMGVARTKVENIKKLTGNAGEVVFASQGDKSAGDSFFGRKTGVVLDIPENMMEYQDDVIEMYRTVDRHPWSWEHTEERYVDSADAFNGYLRGEWEFDVTLGKGDVKGKIKTEIPALVTELPPADDTADTSLIRQSDRDELMQLMEAEDRGDDNIDEERMSELLQQRADIRDRKRSSSGVRAPGAMAIAEAQASATTSKLADKTLDVESSDKAFKSVAPKLFKFEGGFQNNPKDKGNFYKGKLIGTNMGISAAQYKNLFGEEPTEDKLKALTPEKVEAVYKERYWDANKVGEMPPELQEMAMNMFVMTSPKNVVKAIQRASGAKEDGIIGPQTLKAMRGVSKEEIWEEYHDYLKSLKGYSEFGPGWRNRYKELLNA